MSTMKTSIDHEVDGLETAILLAMHARKKTAGKAKKVKAKNGWERMEAGMEMFCPAAPEFPKDMIAFDVADAERLYSCSMHDIVVSPEKAIGRRLEIGMLCNDGQFKWTLIKPIPAPKGLTAITNGKPSWFAFHFRTIQEGKPDEYVKRPFALVNGEIPLMRPMGWKGFNASVERSELQDQLAMTLSVFEDAMRSASILATVEEHTKIRFPVSEGAYKSFFALRDGLKNTPTGRRNPILHWCAEHLRSRGGHIFPVVAHDRGTTEIQHGAMRLTLERQNGYGEFLASEQNETKT